MSKALGKAASKPRFSKTPLPLTNSWTIMPEQLNKWSRDRGNLVRGEDVQDACVDR